jgi:hypothetical protein
MFSKLLKHFDITLFIVMYAVGKGLQTPAVTAVTVTATCRLAWTSRLDKHCNCTVPPTAVTDNPAFPPTCHTVGHTAAVLGSLDLGFKS